MAGDAARGMIRRNEELAWQEGYYRGYFHLTVTAEKSTAKYYGKWPFFTWFSLVDGSGQVRLRSYVNVVYAASQALPVSPLATAGTFLWPISRYMPEPTILIGLLAVVRPSRGR